MNRILTSEIRIATAYELSSSINLSQIALQFLETIRVIRPPGTERILREASNARKYNVSAKSH